MAGYFSLAQRYGVANWHMSNLLCTHHHCPKSALCATRRTRSFFNVSTQRNISTAPRAKYAFYQHNTGCLTMRNMRIT